MASKLSMSGVTSSKNAEQVPRSWLRSFDIANEHGDFTAEPTGPEDDDRSWFAHAAPRRWHRRISSSSTTPTDVPSVVRRPCARSNSSSCNFSPSGSRVTRGHLYWLARPS